MDWSENTPQNLFGQPGHDVEAIALIQRFFDAFDSRDYAAIEEAFAPGATLVHNNGVMTSLAEMLEIIRTTKEWSPRVRELSGFRTRWVDRVAVVGLRNRVTVEPQNRPSATATYSETWLLQRTESGLKAFHVHYSLVTAEKHSEG